MMGPKSFPRIVYITSIKGWVHDYTLLGAGYWSGRIWDRTTIRGGTPYAPRLSLMRRWKLCAGCIDWSSGTSRRTLMSVRRSFCVRSLSL
jgi:hypothetical protein